MIGNANTDGVVMIVVKVMKGWIFGQDDSEFAREVLVNERFGLIWDENVFLDGFFGFWNESENFARIETAVL